MIVKTASNSKAFRGLTGLRRNLYRGGLGCGSCGPKLGRRLGRRLGQDSVDVYGGSATSPDTFNPDTLLPYQATSPTFGPAAPTAADLAYDKAYIASGPNQSSPAYNFQPPTTSTGTGIFSSAGIPNFSALFSPTSSPMIGANPSLGAASTASSNSNLITYALLGLGCVALIAALKRR